MEEHQFDDLTKHLARPLSRRQVLKAVVAATVGGLFVRESGAALAAGDPCTRFCRQRFATAQEAQKCIDQGKQQQGLCYSACGPYHQTGQSGNLCGPNNNGVYQKYATTYCCTSGQVCATNMCVTGTCNSASSCSTTFVNCNTSPNTNCYCFTDINGAPMCGCNTFCSQAASCSSDADCGAGNICISSNGCTGCATDTGVCVAACNAQSMCTLSAPAHGSTHIGKRQTVTGEWV